MWKNEVVDNNVGMACGETEVIFAYNWIHHNTHAGLEHGGGSVARIYSNLIEHNGTGMAMVSYHAWTGYAEIANNTIASNELDGVLLRTRATDQALAPTIRDNVIVRNGGYGVRCTRPYGPMGHPDYPDHGGCYPQLRYNDLWSNNYLPNPPIGYAEDHENNYANCPACFTEGCMDSGRIIMPLSFDPDYDADYYLNPGSLALDAGSLSLDPGYTRTGWGGRLFDRGQLDLGFHRPPSGAAPWLD